MDLQSFKTNVLSSKNKLFRFAKQFSGSIADAEDTVQDVFLKLWDIRDQLDTYNSVEALAMTMTKNICLNKMRSKQNLHFSIDNHLENRAVSASQMPDKKMEQQDIRKQIEKAMQQLSETQRIILQLRDVEEYEMEEIAEIIQKDELYIRVNLSRARKKIREILSEINS